MAVQLHCAENVANIFTLLPPLTSPSLVPVFPPSVSLKNILRAAHWSGAIPLSQADPWQDVPGTWHQSAWLRQTPERS